MNPLNKLRCLWRTVYDPIENTMFPKKPLFFLKETLKLIADQIIRVA